VNPDDPVSRWIRLIIAQKSSDERALRRLGSNMSRFSELTGLGREVFWDRSKAKSRRRISMGCTGWYTSCTECLN